MGSIQNQAQMLSEGGYQTRNRTDLWLTGTMRLTPIKDMSINFDFSVNPREQRQIHYLALLPFYDIRCV